MVLWQCCVVILRYCGTLVLWYLCIVEFLYCGTMVLLQCSTVVLQHSKLLLLVSTCIAKLVLWYSSIIVFNTMYCGGMVFFPCCIVLLWHFRHLHCIAGSHMERVNPYQRCLLQNADVAHILLYNFNIKNILWEKGERAIIFMNEIF